MKQVCSNKRHPFGLNSVAYFILGVKLPDDPKYHLRALLSGSSFDLPVPRPRTKVHISQSNHHPSIPLTLQQSPALLKLLEEAQNKLDQKAYEDMTRSISLKHLQTHSVAQELKQANRAITAMLNVVFSMVAVFTALFYFGHTLTHDVALVSRSFCCRSDSCCCAKGLSLTIPLQRTLFSLAGALVVGFAEGWFFGKDLLKNDI